MNSNQPTLEQWRHFNLRTRGLPFSRHEYEGWHSAYLNNDNLDDLTNPTSDEHIERVIAKEPQPYDLSQVYSFSIALPSSLYESQGIAGLLESLSNLVETEGVKNIATVTLYEMLDYAGADSPQLDVWLA